MAAMRPHTELFLDAARVRNVDAWARAAMLGTIVDQPSGS